MQCNSFLEAGLGIKFGREHTGGGRAQDFAVLHLTCGDHLVEQPAHVAVRPVQAGTGEADEIGMVPPAPRGVEHKLSGQGALHQRSGTIQPIRSRHDGGKLTVMGRIAHPVGGGGQRPRTVVANPFLPELARPSRARCERQYWSHRVTALEPSISVNVFSETAELLAYYRIQMRSLKTLEAFFGKPLLLGGTLVEFFSTLAAAVMPPDDVPVRDAQLAL